MSRRVVLLLGVLLSPVARAEPDVELRGDLRLYPRRRVLKGRVIVRLKNVGAAPMRSIPLVLYGARFRKLDPRINDLNFDRYYVRWFRPGDMTLDSVRTPGGRPLQWTPATVEEGLPPGTVVRVDLQRPVPPGRWGGVQVAYTLRIPQRLGTFGFHDGRITLEAGALPFVPARDRSGRRRPRAPPARTRFDLSLRVEPGPDGEQAPVLVDGKPFVPGQRLRFVAESPFIAAGADLVKLLDQPRTPTLPGVEVFGAPGGAKRARHLTRLAIKAARYLRDHWLADGADPLGPVTIVEAPLRDRFVHVADSVVMVSDRIFDVFFLLKRFHEAEVTRGVLLALIRQRLASLPLGADRDWVSEAIAWHLTRGYLARQAGLKGKQIANLMDLFSFIPRIDQLLRAPRFTGSDLFYGRTYEPRDAVPDTFTRALADRARGRVVAEKLTSKLGKSAMRRWIEGLLGSGSPITGPRVRDRGDARGQAETLYGGDLEAFIDLWVHSRVVKQNLSFKDVETIAEHPDGSVTSKVVIAREGDERVGKVGEPVVVQGKTPGGKRVRVEWDGYGMEGTVVLRHDGGFFSPLKIDPDGRVFQTNTGDDVRPRIPVKILLNRFRVKVDLNRGKKNEAAIGITLHPNHDYRHRVILDGAYAQDERALNVGYGIGFGQVIDERSYGAGLGLRTTIARLNEGVLQNDALAQETEGNLISFGAGLGFDTRIDKRNPTWGFKAGVGIDYSDTILGTDFRFVQYQASLGFVYSLIRGTQIAAEVELGLTHGGNRIPSQRLFDAGGEGSVRGVETGKFVGKASFVARTELRQMVFEDLHIPVLWIAWVRRVQVVLFLDTGDVGDDLRAVYESRTDWKWGTGFGIRLWLDAFGVTNVTARFDVGFRIDETRELGPEFYVGIGQSF